MLFNPILSELIKKVVSKVQERNTADPEVKTADPSVFEKMKEQLETKGHEVADTDDDLCDVLCEEVNQVQAANEADPAVETADNSVFEEMKKELEALKAKVASQEKAASTPDSPAVPHAANAPGEVMAMTNSMGGSLRLRRDPSMGAESFDARVPDDSLVRVVEYSDNKIILDGKESRFVLIEVNGQQGWILESYLNFN